MSLFDWVVGKPQAPKSEQPIVTVGVSSDEWLEWMLDELDEKDRRKRIASDNHMQTDLKSENI